MSIKSYSNNQRKFFEVYLNGTDSRGRRVQRRKIGIESLRKAQQIEFELKRELAKLREEEVPPRWSEWLEECLKRLKLTHRASTVLDYDKQLKKWVSPLWGERELSEITTSDVHEMVFERIDSKLAPHTRRNILKMTKRIFQIAVEEGRLPRNPCAGIQVRVPEVEAKVLTNAEALLFLQQARQTEHRFYPIWFLALATGMRSGELMALTWADIDLDARILRVRRQWTSKAGFGPTKTQRSRVVPIAEDLVKFLRELKLKQGSGSEFVLPHLREWDHGLQAQVTRDFCRSIGVTPVKFHDLRATFITNLLSRGVPLAQVMSVVGHSQLKTTNSYLRKAGVEVRGVTDQLGYKLPEAPKVAQILSFARGEG
jgi:integrase